MPADGQEKRVRGMLTSLRQPALSVVTRLHLRESQVLIMDVLPQIFPDIIGHLEKYLDDLRIELATGPEIDFLANRLNGLGITVITLGSHGIQRIGDRENAGA
jgi:hypothetical protein